MKWSNKKVLVTGGAGFIGKRIASKLTTENAEVLILDNFSYSSPSNLPDGIKILDVDVSDTSRFNSALANEELDFIFHFAAPSSIVLFNRNPVGCFNETTAGVMNVFQLAKEKNVQKVIFPSSGSVYGKVPPPQSENHIPEPVNLYAVAKLSTEYIAQLFVKHVNYTSLRIFAGYGPGEGHKNDYASPLTLFLDSMLHNESPVIFGNGTQSRDFVYIDDVVDAAINSAKSDFNEGVINVGSGSSYTFNEVVEILNTLLSKEIEPKYVAKPLSYLEKTCADIQLMKDVLAVEPLSLHSGLKKYLETL